MIVSPLTVRKLETFKQWLDYRVNYIIDLMKFK